MCSITSLELVGDYCQCRRNFPYKLESLATKLHSKVNGRKHLHCWTIKWPKLCIWLWLATCFLWPVTSTAVTLMPATDMKTSWPWSCTMLNWYGDEYQCWLCINGFLTFYLNLKQKCRQSVWVVPPLFVNNTETKSCCTGAWKAKSEV